MKEPDTLLVQIDRYIDGELSANDLTDLLIRCDSESNGWETCALALIEAREMGAVLNDLVSEAAINLPLKAAQPRRNILASVTCVLGLMFVAYFGGRLSVQPQETLPDVVDAGQTIPSDNENLSTEANAIATGTSTAPVSVIGVARLHQPYGAGPPVPVISGPELDFTRLLQEPPSIPDHLRRQAGNQGLRIETVRQVMALELSDGQKLAVPLDAVGVQYVGHSVL